MNFGAFTVALVIITVLISIAAFNDERLTDRLILWPRRMTSPNEYYRLLSSGFIHADTMHLLFNMFTLYFIGTSVELMFSTFVTPWLFVLMYLTGIVAASLPSFSKHRHDPYYRSLGASGGVAAVLFSAVYLEPWAVMRVMGIPMPSILFAVAYLIYSAYSSKKGRDNVNHDAHFWGAVYGFLFTFMIEPSHGKMFFYQIIRPHFNF